MLPKKTTFLSFLKQYGWLILLSSALLISLQLMSQILQNSSQFAAYYSRLLTLSFIGIAILIGFLIKTLFKLKKQYDTHVPGIKLTLKLTSFLSLIVAIPMAIIYYFALNFIHQGIDQWFDIKTENALADAVALVQTTQDNSVRQALKDFQQLTKRLTPEISTDPITAIDKIRRQMRAQEAAIYSKNAQLIAYSNQFATNILPNQPDNLLFQQLKNHHPYAAIENAPGTENIHQVIRLLIPVTDLRLQTEYLIQTIIPIPDNQTQLTNQVKIAAGQYNELSYLRTPLKTSITLILSLTLLLTLVTAILFIVQTIQNLARPIKILAKGTQAVMLGDYTQTIPKQGEDDFGQLIDSFNKMTQQIAKTRNQIKFAHQQTEVQKLYLQAIIKSLTSGVITFSPHKELKTINEAANQILNVELFKQQGKLINEIIERPEAEHLAPLFQTLFETFERKAVWNQQLEFQCKNSQKILLIHGSTLPSYDQITGGFVIIIEDITQIVQAQLHAAWSDVAQRLAHEIKNPLTPIQLSAERLNYKLHPKLDKEDQTLLSRMTHTIIEQVDAMKNLVQAFTEYADTPEIERRHFNLNHLVQDVANMYSNPSKSWHIKCKLTQSDPIIHADTAKLRQLLHNLVKNALEACENQPDSLVTLRTELNHEQQIILSVCDNGPGLPEEAQNWIFEPYATDKPKGTGLGLAIVKKIVDEHHAEIRVETTPSQGTCFIITFNHPANKLQHD